MQSHGTREQRVTRVLVRRLSSAAQCFAHAPNGAIVLVMKRLSPGGIVPSEREREAW